MEAGKVAGLFESLNSLEHLEELIRGEIRESEVLEYKQARETFGNKEKNEIAKDVSAMANSSGGVIIYGVATDPDDPTRPAEVTGIDPANIETFHRVVNSTISPPIPNLQWKVIPKEGPVKVMVIGVPKSEESPHQSLVDNKYYYRAGTESRPMDHHMVELHFGRRLGPLLELHVVPVSPPDPSKLRYLEDGFSEPLQLWLFLLNTGKRVARYTRAILLFPGKEKVTIVSSSGLDNIDELYAAQERQARQFSLSADVVHPGLRMRIGEVSLRCRREWVEGRARVEPLIEWTIYADEMKPREGVAFLPVFKHVVY
jgi:hypothetical protein